MYFSFRVPKSHFPRVSEADGAKIIYILQIICAPYFFHLQFNVNNLVYFHKGDNLILNTLEDEPNRSILVGRR